MLPERFDLTYVDEHGTKVRPVVIHRAILGTFDRFMAYLIEEYKGAFPVWLAPTQVNIIPVNLEYHQEYAKEIYELLHNHDLRVKLDDRNEKLGYRMRESVMNKIPFALVLGDKERDQGLISYRRYGSNETITVSKEEFLSLIEEEIKNKVIYKA